VGVLNFHQLTSEEGLYEATNEFIFTDRDNITWIDSLDGVFQFDGKNIVNFNTTPLGKARGCGKRMIDLLPCFRSVPHRNRNPQSLQPIRPLEAFQFQLLDIVGDVALFE